MLEKSLRPIDGLDVEGGHQVDRGKAIETEGTKDSDEGHKQRVRSLVLEPHTERDGRTQLGSRSVSFVLSPLC